MRRASRCTATGPCADLVVYSLCSGVMSMLYFGLSNVYRYYWVFELGSVAGVLVVLNWDLLQVYLDCGSGMGQFCPAHGACKAVPHGVRHVLQDTWGVIIR